MASEAMARANVNMCHGVMILIIVRAATPRVRKLVRAMLTTRPYGGVAGVDTQRSQACQRR
ncbi:MAG: hypothetical protein RLW42_20480, partial [Gammaproteobacteria bacterium]